MTKKRKAPARVFAVVALIAGFIVLVVVFSSAMNGGDSDDGGKNDSAKTTQKTRPAKDVPKVYVVETEDTLTAIARKTGVGVAKIERLNPQVDPLSLIAGEKLKLK